MKYCLSAFFLCLTLMLCGIEDEEEILYSNPLQSIEKLTISQNSSRKDWKPEITTEGNFKCVKIEPGGTFGAWVELPEGETILFSVRMKYQNVKRKEERKHWTGATFKAMLRIPGEETSWPGRVMVGSSDWKTVTFKVNVPLGKGSAKAWIRCALEGAAGTAWYRDLSVKVLK